MSYNDKKKKEKKKDEGGFGFYAGSEGIGLGYGLTDNLYMDRDGLHVGFKL